MRVSPNTAHTTARPSSIPWMAHKSMLPISLIAYSLALFSYSAKKVAPSGRERGAVSAPARLLPSSLNATVGFIADPHCSPRLIWRADMHATRTYGSDHSRGVMNLEPFVATRVPFALDPADRCSAPSAYSAAVPPCDTPSRRLTTDDKNCRSIDTAWQPPAFENGK